MSKIRTRFAPSPTGYLHIGGARTALFAWLYAKSRQGECLLRIEDTDKTRSKNEYTEEIINSFKWLGITFDQETIFQESALYKVKSKSLFEERHIQNIIKNSNAIIVTVSTDFFVIEKTGFREETEKLYNDLAPYGLLQFVRSGRIAVTKEPLKISEILKKN